MRLVKRVVWKILSFFSRPIKASLWYRSLFIDYEHELYPSVRWFRKHDERNFDIVSVGSSSAVYAFDWNSSKVRGMNWGQAPQSLVNSYKLIQNFYSIVRRNGTILITLCPFSSLHSEQDKMETLRYVNLLSYELLEDMPCFAEACRLRDYPILLGKPAIKAGIKHLLGRERTAVDVRLTLDHNPMSAEELGRDAENWMRGWARQFGISDFEAPLTQENQAGRKVRIQVMRKLVDFIVERGYRPVYVIPPVEPHLAIRLTPRFRELYITNFLKEVNRPVKLLDYTNDPEFGSADYYFNSFFLNKRGRELFTQRVWRDLQK